MTLSNIPVLPYGPLDTHVHLDRFPDPVALADEVRLAGLAGIVAVGMDHDSCHKIREAALSRPDFILPAYGAHPWNVKEDTLDADIEFVRRYLAEAVALGEVGLDYKVKVPRGLQERALAAMLSLAAEMHKPVMMHARYSQRRCLEMLADAGIDRAVFHWYSGPLDILDELLCAGHCISATPALAYSPPHQEAIRHTPMERILVETDAPVDYGNVPSTPMDVLTTLRLLAEIKGISEEEATLVTRRNANLFLGLD